MLSLKQILITFLRFAGRVNLSVHKIKMFLDLSELSQKSLYTKDLYEKNNPQLFCNMGWL